MSKTSGAKVAGKKTIARAKTNKLAASKTAVAPKTSPRQVPKPNLQRWNVWLAVIFGIQAAAILLLSVVYKVPVQMQYLAPNPLSPDKNLIQATRTVFELNLVQVVAVFLLLAAIGHLVAATAYRNQYESELEQGINRVRWIEYAVTTPIMVAALALLGGVYDIASLLMMFVLSAGAQVLKLFAELQGKGSNKLITWRVACAASFTPWIVLGLYVFGTHAYGVTHLPNFVYWLYSSMAILFSTFAVNQYLQITRRGRWTAYLHGEKIYLVLSLITKTALAWQIFIGVLRP